MKSTINTDNSTFIKVHSLRSRPDLEQVSQCVHELLCSLGIDPEEEGLQETPRRVAKAFVEELFSGLYRAPPKMQRFAYHSVDKKVPVHIHGIEVHSICEHHLLPMWGWATVSYLPDAYLLGISKVHRLVDYWSRRPQLQEKLIVDLAREISKAAETPHVAVTLSLNHGCVQHRGVCHAQGQATTHLLEGCFRQEPYVLLHLASAGMSPELRSEPQLEDVLATLEVGAEGLDLLNSK